MIILDFFRENVKGNIISIRHAINKDDLNDLTKRQMDERYSFISIEAVTPVLFAHEMWLRRKNI